MSLASEKTRLLAIERTIRVFNLRFLHHAEQVISPQELLCAALRTGWPSCAFSSTLVNPSRRETRSWLLGDGAKSNRPATNFPGISVDADLPLARLT